MYSVLLLAMLNAPAQCPTCPTAGARVGFFGPRQATYQQSSTVSHTTTERHAAGPVLGGRTRLIRFALPHPVRRVLFRPWAGR